MTEPSSPNPNAESLSRFQVLIAMGVTAVLLLICAKLWLLLDQSAEMLPVRWNGLSILLGAGIGVGITTASRLMYRVWGSYRQSADYYLELVIRPLALLDLIWLGLLPGLSEELLFRGVMLPSLGLTWFGLILSSACFGVLHFSGSQHWSYVVWATVIGGALGLSAILTGNLLVPIVAHIATNLISSWVWKLKR
ncbi:MAG: lysostaphin resistance A-like protein [Elainella sp.]